MGRCVAVIGMRGRGMETTWVYFESEPGLWTVGFYTPAGKWEPESDHESSDKAAERVHYLNGGA
jgi:hypothetical protein